MGEFCAYRVRQADGATGVSGEAVVFRSVIEVMSNRSVTILPSGVVGSSPMRN
jgi:hypothetical protein